MCPEWGLKPYMKKIIRVVSFGIAVVVFLNLLVSVFQFKYRDGFFCLDRFYSQTNHSADVLVFGSSHAAVDIDSAILYNDAGITSYTLWGSGQPIWNTYYYMKEALDYRPPKLIILEAFTLFVEYDYADESSIVKNTYGIRDLRNFVNAVKVSATEEEWLDYWVRIGRYHNRYLDLGKVDFNSEHAFPYVPSFKGSELSFATNPQYPMPVISQFDLTDCTGTMTDKCEEYFRKCIELAQSKNIPILIAVSPFPLNERQARVYEEAAQIAAEYGVDTVNGNLMYQELGMDFTSDMADGDHLNYVGALKWTSYLANYIQENYDLPDRRSDPAYDSWAENARIIQSLRDDQSLRDSSDINQYLALLTDTSRNYEAIVLPSGDYYPDLTQGSSTISEWITWFQPISELADSGSPGLLVLKDHQWEIMYVADGIQTVDWDGNELVIRKIGDEIELFYNANSAVRAKDGINFVVYNHSARTLADLVGFDASENYRCIR